MASLVEVSTTSQDERLNPDRYMVDYWESSIAARVKRKHAAQPASHVEPKTSRPTTDLPDCSDDGQPVFAAAAPALFGEPSEVAAPKGPRRGRRRRADMRLRPHSTASPPLPRCKQAAIADFVEFRPAPFDAAAFCYNKNLAFDPAFLPEPNWNDPGVVKQPPTAQAAQRYGRHVLSIPAKVFSPPVVGDLHSLAVELDDALKCQQPASRSVSIGALNASSNGWRGHIKKTSAIKMLSAVWGTDALSALLASFKFLPYEAGTDTLICDANRRVIAMRAKAIEAHGLIQDFGLECRQFAAHCRPANHLRSKNSRGVHFACIAGTHRQYVSVCNLLKLLLVRSLLTPSSRFPLILNFSDNSKARYDGCFGQVALRPESREALESACA